MKFKYYLRGCGLGILLTVLVMAVALHNRGGVMTDEKVIARAEELGMVMPEATQDTMDTWDTWNAVDTQSATEQETQTDLPDGTQDDVSKVKSSVTTDSEDDADPEETSDPDEDSEKTSDPEKTSDSEETLDPDEDSDPQKVSVSDKPSESEKSSETIKSAEMVATKSNIASGSTAKASSDETVTVRVERGDVCRDVSEKLRDNGLITDADAFREYMQDNGYDHRICIGSFRFQKGMSFEQIAKILVGKA